MEEKKLNNKIGDASLCEVRKKLQMNKDSDTNVSMYLHEYQKLYFIYKSLIYCI